MTEVDAVTLSKCFTVEDTYKNIQKVLYVKFMLITKIIFVCSMDMDQLDF